MKPEPVSHKITPSLDILPFAAPRGIVTGTPCPNCGTPLTLTQPDHELPYRLIGSCGRCKHWFLIDTLPDATGGTMVRLPDVQVVRGLSRGNPADGISLMEGERGDARTGPGNSQEQ